VLNQINRERGDLFASTGAPGRLELWFAGLLSAMILVLFFATAPFAHTPMPRAPIFIGAYAGWFALAKTVTGILLFALFLNRRSPPLFVLAAGSLLMPLALAIYVASHAISAPAPSWRSGMATFWGGAYPAFVIAYAVLGGAAASGQERSWGPARWRPGAQVVAFLCLPLAISSLIYVLTIFVGPWLMPPTGGNQWPIASHYVSFAFAALSAAAVAALARLRARSVLDLWLLVGMIALTADLVLNGFSNARYDLGWYAAHALGLVSASTLLLALLIESAAHYGRLTELNEALVASNRALEHLSLHDALTGLPNRRYFDTYLGGQVSLARRRQHSLALVLIDVDCFKAYNDLYGHLAGDECLTRVAAALTSCCRRPSDMAARYGGEEFALILPETDLAGAMRIAETAREAVLTLKLPHLQSVAARIVSVSGGVAVFDGRCASSADALIAGADEGLFLAKSAGRNCIVSPAVANARAEIRMLPASAA
jgi:diguanylate cyclase (GGDEF)-like protein